MRKAKPKETATEHYSVNVTPSEKDLIERAAEADQERMASRWIRRVALKAASEVLEPKKKAPR